MSNPIASSSLNHKEGTIAVPTSITIPEDSVSPSPGDTQAIRHDEMSPEALFRRLQFLETSCYGMIMSTFRAQGELTWQKHKILEDLRVLLHISPQRHRAEMLRTESDPLLQKIATHCNEKEHVRPQYEEEEVATAEQTRLAEKALYSYSDTESEAEEVQQHRFAAPKLRGTRRQYAADTTKKRGRKRKEREEGAVEKPKRGKVGRPPKEKVDAVTAAAVDTILAQTDYRDISTLSYEDVEVVAEKEQQQIEELDKLLNQTDDLVQKQRIMAEVQRKKDKLIELIEHLEALV